MENSIYYYAKLDSEKEPALPLINHLLDVSSATYRLWDILLPKSLKFKISEDFHLNIDETGKVLAFVAGLHDIGKATEYFQEKVLRKSDITKKTKISLLVPLYDEAEIEQWLADRAQTNGLKIIGIPEFAKYYQNSFKPKPDGKGKQEITHFGVKFDGVLKIENSELAHNAVKNGIGKGKSFGFGLLSLVKAK